MITTIAYIIKCFYPTYLYKKNNLTTWRKKTYVGYLNPDSKLPPVVLPTTGRSHRF